MRVLFATVVISLLAVSSSGASHQQEKRLVELGFSATPDNIARVVAGNTCAEPRGDTLVFGEVVPGVFEHVGHKTATYRLGYASLLVERGGELHTHVVTVDPTANALHYNGARYLCKRPTK